MLSGWGEGEGEAVSRMKQVLPQFHSPLSRYVYGYCMGEDDQICGYLSDLAVKKMTPRNSQNKQ